MAASFTTCTWKSRYISSRIYQQIKDVTNRAYHLPKQHQEISISHTICGPLNIKKLVKIVLFKERCCLQYNSIKCKRSIIEETIELALNLAQKWLHQSKCSTTKVLTVIDSEDTPHKLIHYIRCIHDPICK